MALTLGIAAHAAPLTLVENGRSDFAIVVASNAIPAERYAAEELQLHLRLISGATLPVIDDATPRRGHEILLGCARDSARTNAEPEDFRIETKDGNLIISGGRPRGTLYGVYTLLDEQLGCRWFATGATRIPSNATVRIPPMNVSHHPRFEYREPQAHCGFDPVWSARNRMNSAFKVPFTDGQGDSVRYVPGYFVHTFDKLVPSSKYFAEHPEYYALVDGKRQPSQLCLANADVQRIALEEARRELRAHPEAGIISISQNDGGGYCQCPLCQAVVDREGSQSGPILEFVNRIAAALRDEFPNVAIDTLAYFYSEKPPKSIRPLPNVIVRLCSYNCCSSHPLATCDAKASPRFRENLVGWHRLTDRIWIWDYTINYAHFLQPFPNLLTLRTNIQYFAANGVRGVFEEGDYMNPGGELQELRSYLLARFLWNPGADFEATLTEFLDGYYGAAAGCMRQYIDLIHAPVRDPAVHVGLYDPPSAPYITPDLCAMAQALFDEAEKDVASQPDLLRRVRTARLGVDYVTLARWKPGATEIDAQTIELVARRFMANAAAAGVKTLHEGNQVPPSVFASGILRRIAAAKAKKP